MSYITIPRLVFSGGFQADVSTVNNDVRHFDNKTFESRFQLPQEGTVMNGWYNPDGTGDFRLFDLRVTKAFSSADSDPLGDPIVGLHLNAQRERSSCKIVDLDPQMQVVSTLFGLRVVLTDGTTDYLSGTYYPAPFRDMSNGRIGAGSALYMSTLTDLEWGEDADTSPTLSALKKLADSNDGKLAINLTPWNYGANQMGDIVGSIGAWAKGDPMTFAACRRMMITPPPGGLASRPLIGDMNADLAEGVLSFDLSNSIPLGSDGNPGDIGSLHGAVLRHTETLENPGTSSASVVPADPSKPIIELGEVITEDQLVLLDKIPYLDAGFLTQSAGIADCRVAGTDAEGLIADHPVAIVTPHSSGGYQVMLRENMAGLYARADNFVLRMNPKTSGAEKESVRFKVTQWGKPVPKINVTTKPVPQPQPGANSQNPYWGSDGGSGTNPPKAPYPFINTNPRTTTVSTKFVSGPDGWANCTVSSKNPGNPREYVDGQIYTTTYDLAAENASPQARLDLIVVHAREAHDYPNPPDWDQDIAPFMQQYDNLYPIMSRHLFSISDEAIFKEHATLLMLAFSRHMDDPNHMPATRDLSASKTEAVKNWLAQYSKLPLPPTAEAMASAATEDVNTEDISDLPKPRRASIAALEEELAELDAHDMSGKVSVVRNYLASEIARLSEEG